MLIIFSMFKDIIITYWKPLAIAAICWYGYHENHRAIAAENALSTYKQVIAQQVADQAKSNEIIETKSTKQVELIKSETLSISKSLTPDVAKLKKDISNEYQSRIANLTSANGMLWKRVDTGSQPASEATESAGIPESSREPNGGCAEIQASRERLETACAVTTAYFNACAGYVETVTNLFGTQ